MLTDTPESEMMLYCDVPAIPLKGAIWRSTPAGDLVVQGEVELMSLVPLEAMAMLILSLPWSL